MQITISKPIAREMLGVDREVTIRFTESGPAALPNCYKWRAPMREAWARIECEAYDVDVTHTRWVETPKRAYGRLGQGFEGYASCLAGGDVLVRRATRCGQNDPSTQRAAADVLLGALLEAFGRTTLGQLAGLGQAA